MLLLTKVRRNGRVDMCLVLGDENIERIKQYDPAEINWATLPNEYAGRMPQFVSVSYATPAEMETIQQLVLAGNREAAFALVARGFKFQPERGDHDFGPVVLGKPTEGTKH